MSMKHVVRYWRESLLDADLSALELIDDNHIRLPKSALGEGRLDTKTTRSLFNSVAKSSRNGSSKGGSDDADSSIPVIIAPIVAVKKRSRAYGKRRVICPILIPARLNLEGCLEADPRHNMPWMPRTLLEPTGSNLVLGSIDDFTAYLDANDPQSSADPQEDWKALEAFTWQMFTAVAGEQWRELFKNADYRLENEAALLPIEVMRGISANIIKVYDELRESGDYPPLLTTYAQLKPDPPSAPLAEEKWDAPAKYHLGSFSKEFPLSSSQRQALYHFLSMRNNNVLAISGPPGTGKTTLLHSVIASLWVKAAVEGGLPPVIVASSTNNQAVTNVIDSLSGSGDLKRWIDVGSYGLYLVNARKKIEEAENRGILTSNNWGDGFPSRAEKAGFIYEAHGSFLRNCKSYFKRSFDDLDKAVETLHAELSVKIGVLQEGIDLAWKSHDWQSRHDLFVEEHGSLEKALVARKGALQEPAASLERWQAVAESWQALEKPDAGVLSRLKSITGTKRKGVEKRQAFVAEHLPEMDPQANHQDIGHHINRELGAVQARVQGLQRDIDELKRLAKEIDQATKDWRVWCIENKASQLEVMDLFVLEKPAGIANKACLLNWLDTNLRYNLFVLATHYWEGRWLQTVIADGFIDPDHKESRNRQSQEAKWRRYAMLTPCFVTTMHSGPRFFDYYDGESHFLTDYIDLLIVDEAGQVTPEVSGGMFALARQALVVGDIQQIEPVWSVPQQVDRGNLAWFGLLGSNNNWDSLQQKGVTASAGSVMQMAQSVSPFQLPPHNGASYERGMFLAEHRRCVPEVIGYCNELAYQGQLRPMRSSLDCHPWPHMGYAHIKGISTRANGSRMNEREAQAIAAWIAENKEKLEICYSEKAEGPVDIENILGIVTPFAAQKRAINAALQINNISLSKVGTVHALQGGERPLVLFSPVYCSRDRGSYFFDQGPNMLNVAVSRAKDSFLVFGDMDIFDPFLRTPSGILARYLFADEKNELIDFKPPSRTDDNFENKELHLVNSLQMHIGTLSRAFKKAEEELVIVSPYLRWRAVEADGLAQKTDAAVDRGVQVTIYVDDGFNDRLELPSAAKAAETLQKNGAEIKLCHNIHSKIICIDHDIFVEGSFNWLSAERVRNEHVRHETSMIYMGPQASDFISDTIRDIETTVIG